MTFQEARGYIGWIVKTNETAVHHITPGSEGVILDVYPSNVPGLDGHGFTIRFDNGEVRQFWHKYVDIVCPPPSKEPLPLPG